MTKHPYLLSNTHLVPVVKHFEKPHLGAYGLSVLAVVTFWLGFGRSDVDPGGLARGRGSGNFFAVLKKIGHQLELYKKNSAYVITLMFKS